MVDILCVKKKKLISLTQNGVSERNFVPFRDRVMTSNFEYIDGTPGLLLAKRSSNSEMQSSISFSDVALVPGAILPNNYLSYLPVSDVIIGSTSEFKLVQITDDTDLLVLGSTLSARAWEVRSPFNLKRGIKWSLTDKPEMNFIIFDDKFFLIDSVNLEGWYTAGVSTEEANYIKYQFIKRYLFDLSYRKGSKN